MELSREEVDYRTLVGAVVPRPIAWVSTVSAAGVPNLAPFSFFNVVTSTPPVLSVSVTRYDPEKPDRLKDTFVNVRETGEFVVNVVTRPLLERMNRTSARHPHEVSEFDDAGVGRTASSVVEPDRVAEAQVSFECVVYDLVPVGKATVVLGDVVCAHVDDDLTVDGKLDVNEIEPVGRLSAGQYGFIEERIELERPP